MPPKSKNGASGRWKKTRMLAGYLKSKKKRPGQAKKALFSARSIPPTGNDALVSYLVDGIGGSSDAPVAETDWEFDDDEEAGVSQPPEKKQRTYKSLRKKEGETWQRIHESVFGCFVGLSALKAGTLCIHCLNFAEYRCQDCSTIAYYCKGCCSSHHQQNHFLHFPEKWMGGRYILAPLQNVEIPLSHLCSTTSHRTLTIVSLRGI